MERCDTISNESGEKAMSFDRFVTFSLENNIFSEEKFKVKIISTCTRDFRIMLIQAIQ